VTGGKNAAKWQETGHKAIVPKLERLNDAFERPAEEDEDAVAKETILAIQGKVDKKQAVMNPKHVPQVPGEAQYIRYTGSSAGAQTAGRIIKMQDMPVDPLEPPKFKHIKVPRGSGSPPAPVMHSPPRKLSAEERQDWKIPPCVSNWKNNAGHTIPLDKRLAADGRGLQEVQINDGFAKFSEALYIAENKARNAVETRAKMQRELLSREKERKEAELRELAMNARMERSGRTVDRRSVRDGRDEGVAVVRQDDDQDGNRGRDHRRDDRRDPDYRDDREDRDYRGDRPVDYHRRRDHSASPDAQLRGASNHRDRDDDDDRRDAGGSREESAAQRRRDEIREDRRKERERERRLEARNAHGYKRSKLTRDKDRDISEKIALGMAKVTGGEAMYDQRLFNQETGQQAGVGADDTYNLYDKPLFTDRSDVYRGRASNREGEDPDVDTSRFKPSKGFSGADKSSGKAVEFEKEGDGGAADPFGLDDFLTK
jgi:SNW domain-containing protein 1